MFKPVHGIRGVLTAPITAFSVILFVDNDSLCLLQKRLPDAGDYTYLLIRAAYDYEIVKVTAVSSVGVTVERGQDNTTAQTFLTGSAVEFVLSEAAIAEIINQKALGEVVITGEGMVTVQKTGPNQFLISAPEIDLTSDSSSILVGGEFPNFVISSPLLTDCCG